MPKSAPGVGKRVGAFLYVHKDALPLIGENTDTLRTAENSSAGRRVECSQNRNNVDISFALRAVRCGFPSLARFNKG